MEPVRAIGIVRVSRSDGRAGESFSSPRDQADRIETLAAEKGWQLTIPEPYEIDVSGDALLSDRPQLSRAVVAVQTGEAEIIAGAHTERLWWNHETAAQVIRLVEDAGGEVWSADQGLLTQRSAADEFSGTVRTAADRLSRRQNAEKSAAAVRRAIRRGVAPWPRVTTGYRKRPDGVYEPDPKTAPAVREAFELRAQGRTVREVRAHLATKGVHLTYAGTVKLLKSPAVVGEIRFGTYHPNLEAHEPIVDRATWEAVQRTRVPAGRNSKSRRLLARLGVLRCGTCESKLVASIAIGAGGGRYPIYRCQNADCSRRVTISAPLAEERVCSVVRAILADVQGRASAQREHREAVADAERSQVKLERLIELLDPFEPAARRRIELATAERDADRERVAQLGGVSKAHAVDVSRWDDLTVDERRDLVRGTLAVVRVLPGRGPERLDFEPLV
jgi:DNA invertase Pin-like site-specific DNA recombinase